MLHQEEIMKNSNWIWALSGLAFFAAGCGNNISPAPSSPSSPAPLCASPSQHGVTTGFASNLFISTNTLYAQAVTLSSTATAMSVGVYLTPVTSFSISGQVWLAVYNDNGSSAPGDLIVSSVPQNAVTGWNTLDVTNLSLPAPSATTYWLALEQTGDANVCPAVSSGNLHSATYTWAAFPPAFPSATTSSFSLEMVVNTCP